MEKLTNVKALEIAINALDDKEVIAKLENIKASYEKKSATKSTKPTKAQTENVGFKDTILASMESGKAYTISDMIKGFDLKNADGDALSNQRVSAIVRQMVLDNLVSREEIKRKAYFTKVEA